MQQPMFKCRKKDVDDLTFPMEVLKIFTFQAQTAVLIEGYGIVDKGVFRCLLNKN